MNFAFLGMSRCNFELALNLRQPEPWSLMADGSSQ